MRIEHIDEVLPHVEGRKDFVVARKDGYVVVDYLFQEVDTFTVPVRRECRGIKFCSETGKVLARPFGKFFNIGEREETQPHRIDFGRPHWIMTKMDGTMVHPMMLRGDVVLCTRMGRTQHGMTAERHLTPELRSWFQAAMEGGWTPICEWVAPDNRIIIKYPESKLVLLAIRNTTTGDYMEPSDVRANGLRIGLDAVDHHPSWSGNAHDFLEMVRAIKDAEGFVVRFADGDWYKCKAEDYVRKHGVKSAIELEKNVLAVIVSGGLDDVKPLLGSEHLAAIEAYEAQVVDGMLRAAEEVSRIVQTGSELDQKTFATAHMKDIDQTIRTMAFQVRKGTSALEAVKAFVARNVGSQADVDAIRSVIGNPVWRL